MYSTCLFCNASLGANESLQHFPVGRRLAYDSAAGRLWVVCGSCARWNLSPLETRWEAIEEAEQLFRATKTRVATDNIGLAKLSDDTELVRIGKPPEIELAVWRYGDQFKTRYRKFLMQTSLSSALTAVPYSMVTTTTTVLLGAPFYMYVAAAAVGPILHGAVTLRLGRWRHRVLPVATVRDADNTLLRLTQSNINAATLTTTDNSEWTVSLPHVSVKAASAFTRVFGGKLQTDTVHAPVELRGAAAIKALPLLLAHTNRVGSTNAGVEQAMKTVHESENLDALLRRASNESVYQANRFAKKVPGNQIAYAPEPLRLALEMSLHADDERRAMEGELTELEQRWRDADAIAKISDELFLPDSVEARLHALHGSGQSSQSADRTNGREQHQHNDGGDEITKRAEKS